MTNSVKWLGLGLLTLFMGCNKFDPCSKVDFLMVVDNSGSMTEYQDKLSEQFSTMVAEIDKMEDVQDYRIGVVTTDAYSFNHEGCRSIGDLVTQTPKEKTISFLSALQQAFLSEEAKPEDIDVCIADTSKPWLEKGDPNIKEKFQCLIEVGALGDSTEKPLEALQNSMTSSCNKGFYREDAMLVTMIVTDEDDATAYGPSIYENILSNRDDLPNQMVVLPIINNAPKLAGFAEMFANHYQGSIESSDYSQVLKMGARKLEMACDNYGNTCAADECCMPNDLMKKVVGYGFPPIFGVLAGFLMGRGFGRTAAENKRFTAGPIAKGHFFGGLLSLAAAIGIWEAFCLNCLASNATYYIAGLAATVALLGFSWFSKRSE